MKLVRCMVAGLLLSVGALAIAAETPNAAPAEKAMDTRSAKEQPPPIGDKSKSSAHKKPKKSASKNHKKSNPPEPDKKINPPEPDKASPAK